MARLRLGCMTRCSDHRLVSAAIAVALIVAGWCDVTPAAPFTWTSTGTSPITDGAGTWNTAGTNWFNGTTYGAWGNTDADTATFGVGSGAAGTITVGGVTANGIAFNAAGSGNYTLSSGTITMAGTTPTITVNTSGTTTLTSVLAGSAGLTKSGTGTLLLGTANTYTGTTTISQGTLRVTAASNTLGSGGSGAVVLNGGTLNGAWTTPVTTSWAITVGANGGAFLGSGAGQLNLAANSLYGSGVLTLRSADGFNRFFNLTQPQNNFSGKWVLDGSGGAFWDNFQNVAAWGTATGDDVVTLINNGTVLLRSDLSSTTKGITFGAGGGYFRGAGAVSATISVKLSGIATGTVTFGPELTNGILTLSNTSNSYAGDTVVLGRGVGTPWLRLGATNVIPDGAGKGNVFITNSGGSRGALDLNGFNETVNGLSSFNGSSFATDSIVDNLAASTSATLTLGGNNASATFAGVIQNTGSSATLALAKIGTGTQTLSGANTYSGATSINAGVLELGAGGTAGSLSGSSAVTIASGATLGFRRSNDYGSFSNAVSGAGSVVVTSGTVTFTGSNSYTGSTTVSGGVLVAGNSNAFGGSATPLVINSGTVSLGGVSVAVGALSGSSGGVLSTSSVAGTTTFTTNVASGTSTFAGSIANNGSGLVAVTKQGSGTLVLAGNNTYTGTTTISQGAIQVNGITNTLGNGSSGSVVLNGGRIVAAIPNSFTPAWNIGVGANGGSIVGSGSVGRWNFSNNSLSGNGTLTLSASNGFNRFDLGGSNSQSNFSGKWVLDGTAGAGFLADQAQGSVWGTGTGTDVVTMVNGGAVLIRGGTVGSSTQGFTIGAGGGFFGGAGGITATIAAQISGTGNDRVTFRPSQGGVLILSNTANAYSGDTYVLGDSFGTNYVRLGAAGVVPNGAGKGNLVIVNSAGAATGAGIGGFDLNGFSQTINGLSSLAISGTLSTDSVVDNLAASTSATLTLGGNAASATFAGVIRNTGSAASLSLRKIGSGIQTLAGSNSYSGATTISAGTLALGVNGSFTTSPSITVGDAGSSGAVLDLTAKTGTFSFTSGQTVGGIGMLNIGSGKTIASQGIWAPGNSIGSNAVTGNLTLTGTSQFELGTPGTSTSAPGASDFTAVSGTLTLGGVLSLLDNAGANGNGSAAGGVYRLYTYGNAVSGSYGSVTANPTPTTRTSLGNITYGGSGTANGNGVFLSIYNLAAANIASGTAVNFGTVLKGTSLSQALTISNTAPGGSYSENLGAAFGSATGQAGGSGSWSLLSAGSASTALSVTLASGSAGVASGSQTLNFASDGAGTSGLSAVSIGSQTVNLTATVLDPAVASFTSGSTAATSLVLNFGSVNQGDSVSPLNFSLYNLLQTAGYTAELALLQIDETNPGGPLSTNLSLFNSLASGTFSSWQASVNTANQGTFNNTWTLQFKSSNGGTVYGADTPQTLTLTTSVIVVPEPGALALVGVGIAIASWARWARSPTARK